MHFLTLIENINKGMKSIHISALPNVHTFVQKIRLKEKQNTHWSLGSHLYNKL